MEPMMINSPEHVRRYGFTNQWLPINPWESLRDVGVDEEPGTKRPPLANLGYHHPKFPATVDKCSSSKHRMFTLAVDYQSLRVLA